MTEGNTESGKDIVVLDLETTGLNHQSQVPWEVFAARCRISQEMDQITIVDHLHLHLPLSEQEAQAHDSVAREMTGFDARYGVEVPITPGTEAANQVMNFFDAGGTDLPSMSQRPHLVGAVPSFDALRLGLFLGRHLNSYYGSLLVEPWHYHYVCVENLLAARLFHLPPWRSHELSEEAGIVNDKNAEHTARGDVIWALDVFANVYNLDITNRALIENG